MIRRVIGSVLGRYIRSPHHRGKARIQHALTTAFRHVPVASPYGVTLGATPDATTLFALRGEHQDVFNAVAAIAPGMAFIDVGANMGVFSFVAADRVGPTGVVLAFEPSPKTFRRLLANIDLNPAPNLHPFMMAVGPRTEIVRFDPGPERHSGMAHLAESGSSAVLQVGPAELESLLRPLLGSRQAMLKVDVEGAELRVLRAFSGLLRSGCLASAIVEIDERYLTRFGDDRASLYAFMDEVGFAPTATSAAAHYDEVFVRRPTSKTLAPASRVAVVEA